MRLAAVLLVIVFGMHFAPDLIANGYAQQIRAAKAWEYILSGAGSAALFLLVGLLARNDLAWPFCVFGAFECGERSVGRLAHPIGPPPPQVDQFSGLLGPGAFWAGLACCLWLAVALLDKTRKP